MAKSKVPIHSSAPVAESLNSLRACKAEVDNLRAKTTSTLPLAEVGFRPQWIDLAASHVPNKGAFLSEKRFQEWV